MSSAAPRSGKDARSTSELSPAAGAVTVALSFFIGLMSLFLAVLSFAVAGRQDRIGAGNFPASDSAAMWLSYGSGFASLFLSLMAFGRARLRPRVTAACVVGFIALTILTNVVYIRAW